MRQPIEELWDLTPHHMNRYDYTGFTGVKYWTHQLPCKWHHGIAKECGGIAFTDRLKGSALCSL